MKLRQLQRELARKDIDCALFLNLSNRQQDWALEYLTGIVDLEYGALVVERRKSYLICFGFEYERFSLTAKIPIIKGNGDILEFVSTLVKKKRTGLNYLGLDHATAEKLRKQSHAELVDVSPRLLALRQTKTEEELSLIKKASRIGDEIIRNTIASFSQFKSENEVYHSLQRQCSEHHVEFSFPPIIASGKHAAIPHHTPSSLLHKGFCVLDFGVKYQGYCSDMTRTIYLGTPTQEEKNIYNHLLHTQQQGIKLLTPGSTFVDVNKQIRELLGPYKEFLIHSFGHSLGMDVHDPMAVPRKELVFEKNMVFTMEPGIYIPGKLGMRIEDDVLIRNKPKALNSTPKELICLSR